MNVFKRKVTEFSKKKFRKVFNIPVCRVCYSDRGLVKGSGCCYKCLYNHSHLTNFRF